MNIGFRVSVSGRRAVDEAARRFEEAASGGLQGRLVRGLAGEAPSALAETRAGWLGVEVSSTRGGGSSSGLRARAAGATSSSPTPRGVKFEVNGSAVDAAYPGLAWYLDGFGRWRHPTWGHAPWQQQSGQEVFFKTLRGHEPGFEGQLARVVDEVAREIEG